MFNAKVKVTITAAQGREHSQVFTERKTNANAQSISDQSKEPWLSGSGKETSEKGGRRTKTDRAARKSQGHRNSSQLREDPQPHNHTTGRTKWGVKPSPQFS